jgi:hypothetical protein
MPDFGDDILHKLRTTRTVVDVAVPENLDF